MKNSRAQPCSFYSGNISTYFNALKLTIVSKLKNYNIALNIPGRFYWRVNADSGKMKTKLNTSFPSGLRLLTRKPCCVLNVPAVKLCCDSACQSLSLKFLIQHSRCSFTWHVTTWSINWKDFVRAFFSLLFKERFS